MARRAKQCAAGSRFWGIGAKALAVAGALAFAGPAGAISDSTSVPYDWLMPDLSEKWKDLGSFIVRGGQHMLWGVRGRVSIPVAAPGQSVYLWSDRRPDRSPEVVTCDTVNPLTAGMSFWWGSYPNGMCGCPDPPPGTYIVLFAHPKTAGVVNDWLVDYNNDGKADAIHNDWYPRYTVVTCYAAPSPYYGWSPDGNPDP